LRTDYHIGTVLSIGSNNPRSQAVFFLRRQSQP